MNPTGRLITIEGIDGVGKSTQAERLMAWFNENELRGILVHEPTDGKWGSRIRAIRSDMGSTSPEEIHQYFLEDRKEDVVNTIAPAILEGIHVVMDRYYHSNIAYQGSMGVDPKRIKRENEAFAPVPDLMLILDMMPSDALARISEGREENPDSFENEELLAKVRERFEKMLSWDYVHSIDAARPLQEVTEEILVHVRSLVIGQE